MASAVNNLFTSGAPASQPATTTGNQAPTEEMFLQLLVAQIKNQDPTNPTDSTQFVSQLAQFSELEQVIAIRGDIEQAAGINQTTGTNTNQTTNQS